MDLFAMAKMDHPKIPGNVEFLLPGPNPAKKPTHIWCVRGKWKVGKSIIAKGPDMYIGFLNDKIDMVLMDNYFENVVGVVYGWQIMVHGRKLTKRLWNYQSWSMNWTTAPPTPILENFFPFFKFIRVIISACWHVFVMIGSIPGNSVSPILFGNYKLHRSAVKHLG